MYDRSTLAVINIGKLLKLEYYAMVQLTTL